MDDLANVGLYLGQGAGAAVTLGLVEVCKRGLPSLAWDRLSAPLALLVGCAWNALVLAQLGLALSPITVVFLGIITGLSASGFYSQAKSVAGR